MVGGLLRGGGKSAGSEYPSEHLVVGQGLAVFGGVTWAPLCGVGIWKPEHPQPIKGQHHIRLLRMEHRTWGWPRLHLQQQQQHVYLNEHLNMMIP